MTGEKDIVLIYLEDKPLVFARIEDISADYKPGWYHVRLLLLQIPLQTVTWIIRDVYIDGEPFTMDGKKLHFEKVESPTEEMDQEDVGVEPDIKPHRPPEGKVISLADLKKKR